jgi:hypothetical protein
VTPEQRATLAGLADVLVPAAGPMPAASSVGVHESRLDRMLAARPDLHEPLTALLAKAAGRGAVEEVERLHVQDPEGFRMLHSVVTAAYYSSPKIRRLVGYPGQRPNEVFLDQAEHDLRDGILDPVIARGPIWHRPPDGAGPAGRP